VREKRRKSIVYQWEKRGGIQSSDERKVLEGYSWPMGEGRRSVSSNGVDLTGTPPVTSMDFVSNRNSILCG
jgi:hypothetical protein